MPTPTKAELLELRLTWLMLIDQYNAALQSIRDLGETVEPAVVSEQWHAAEQTRRKMHAAYEAYNEAAVAYVRANPER